MALYTVVTGNIAAAADLNQIVNLLTGTTTDTPLVVANRIRAQMAGATAASGYVGGTASGPPTTGTFGVGDYVVDQTGAMWVCITAGTPGTWGRTGNPLDTSPADIAALAAASAAGSVGKAADAGHVHPSTGLAVLASSNLFTALQTFNQGVSVTGGLTYQDLYVFSAVNGSPITVGTTLTTMTWFVESDPNFNFSSPATWTAPRSGKYHVSSHLYFAGNASISFGQIFVLVNGLTKAYATTVGPGNTTNFSVQINTIVRLNGGDTVRIGAASGGVSTTLVGDPGGNRFCVQYLGD